MKILNRQRVMLAGILLIMIGVFPTVWGMTHAFAGSSAATQSVDSVGLAMSPPFIAMTCLGITLVIGSVFLR